MQRVIRILLILTAASLLFEAFSRSGLPAAASVTGERVAPDQKLAIIVNASNTVEGLSMEELRRIFLGERSHWSNGRRITLVMMEPEQPERKSVLHQICQMTETEYRNRILHGLFTGDVLVSPKTLATPTGVRKFVFNVPGAIGYVRATDVDASVKVIRVSDRLPEDRDYPLHVEQDAPKQQ